MKKIITMILIMFLIGCQNISDEQKAYDKYFNTSIFWLLSLKANVKLLITSVSYDIISPHLPLIIA